jgi:hypothetical protein
VTTRAEVCESVFYDTFAAPEECYRAAYQQGLRRLSQAVAKAARRKDSCLERVRAALVALLGFFDDEPAWARILVLETPASEVLTLDCRRQLHDILAGPLDELGEAVSDADSPMQMLALTGELIVGGVFSVIRRSMPENDGSKLVELAPSLMAFIVTPYLGHATAQAELYGRSASEVDGHAGAAARSRTEKVAVARAHAKARAAELPIRATRRTTLVLQAIARTPYSNNREVAQAAGLVDEGQTSKLLARLERKGVIENVGVGPARGEPNAWLLTASGRRVLELLGDSPSSQTLRAAMGGRRR